MQSFAYLNSDSNDFGKYAKFTTENVIEHVAVSETNLDVTNTSTSVNETEITNTSTTNSSQVTNANMTTSTAVKNKTQIDNSAETTNTNITDNRSTQNLSNSQENINVDNSQLINETTQTIQNEMIQSCGATIKDAETAITIVEDNSVNTNIDASNTVVNTGDNVTMSNVTLDSNVVFNGPNIDRSCMLDLMNDLDTRLDSLNENAKSFEGGKGGDVGAESGGNTTTNENTTTKKDQLDASMDASQEIENAQSLDQASENVADQSSEIVNETEQTQKTDAEATSSAAGMGVAGGGINLNLVIIILIIMLILMNVKNITKDLVYLSIGGMLVYYYLYM